jgi:hypothetical protein
MLFKKCKKYRILIYLYMKIKFSLGLIITLIALFGFNWPASSQLIKSQSIEIQLDSKNQNSEFKVYRQENGSFILQERTEPTFGKKPNIWRTEKYGEAMNLIWSKEIEIDNLMDFDQDFFTEHTLYQNFTLPSSSKIKLLRIDLLSGNFDWIEGDLVGIQDISDMKIVENHAFFSGKFQGRAVVMSLSFFDGTVKALTGLYSNHTELVEIDANEEKKELHIYTKNRYKNKCELQLRRYDKEGNPLNISQLTNEPRKLPYNGRLYNLDNDQAMIIGNYARYCDNSSQGIYVNILNESNVEKSNFLDFTEFKNFFNFLNPKRQKKVKEKLSKRKEAGKAINFNYSMLVHKLYHFNNQLVMVAEIFYTEARSSASMPMYMNSRSFSPYNYRFTHTIISGFDMQGNKLWDNCLPMKALSSFYLNEQVQLSEFENKLILAYPENGKIKTQVIEEDKTLKEKEEFEVVAKNNNFSEGEASSGLSAWYGQNFLYWGVKNSTDENYTANKVFFINKLTYKL